MHNHRNLRVLDAASLFEDEVKRLVLDYKLSHEEKEQLRRAVVSVGGNIAEAFGRAPGPDRTRFLRYGLGSTEETLRYLLSHYRQGTIPARRYWGPHARGVTISRMLNSLIAGG